MCGIFAILSETEIDTNDCKKIALYSRERGKDSSGFLLYKEKYLIRKYDRDIKDVLSKKPINACTFDESTKILDILGV